MTHLKREYCADCGKDITFHAIKIHNGKWVCSMCAKNYKAWG